ncbi:receptor homology region, transmembrane domain- and RING domain-containing protein 2 [Aplysia californica]|uniref:RING-type E3 ubiquitin transferase n=1 Tax=Aplysia californica TaxID=6500 RepID=A0ABM0K2Y9_APLCA|nr:receptor homology region, transmembrane domain- and RING domain-containing protein 2 [Aplysia californica]
MRNIDLCYSLLTCALRAGLCMLPLLRYCMVLPLLLDGASLLARGTSMKTVIQTVFLPGDCNCSEHEVLDGWNRSQTFDALTAHFGPHPSEQILGFAIPVFPHDACGQVGHAPGLNETNFSQIAVVSRGNCSFETKVLNAERAGFQAAIVYGLRGDDKLVEMENSSASVTVSIPSYFVNYTSGVLLSTFYQNMSRSPLLSILGQTTSNMHPTTSNTGAGQEGHGHGKKGDQEEVDSFGEHYFHICIYIWVCVVVSSLIALSVKWGCCGRSLTRWEVKRLPMKRFQRTDGDDCQDKCPICHEEFHEGRFIRQLPCNHCYHSYCVDRWLIKMSNRCPLCKQQVSISLFCPWNKQRRKKEVHSQITSEADAEAAMDDSPPLPPLATLTPSSWYGEAIMSAPSKLIIMRPGKPTRVIDLQERGRANDEQDVPPTRSDLTPGHIETSGIVESNCTCDPRVLSTCSIADVENVSLRNSRTPECVVSVGLESDDVFGGPCELPRSSSASSSRSCSVSSDQPLLFHSSSGEPRVVRELECCCGGADPAWADRQMRSAPEGSTTGGCVVCQACDAAGHNDSCWESGLDDDDNERKSGGVPTASSSLFSSDSNNSVDVTVDISSASSSVVSCSVVSALRPAASNEPSAGDDIISGVPLYAAANVVVVDRPRELPQKVLNAWDINEVLGGSSCTASSLHLVEH